VSGPRRILVTTIGSSGDVHPFVAVSRALVARGHDVRVAVNPHFRSTVEGAGLVYEPLGAELSPADIAREHPAAFGRVRGAWVLARRVFAPLLPEMAARLIEIAEAYRPDVLVGHQISFGAPWAARRVGARWATCVLAPSTLLSTADPSVYPIGTDARRLPMWMRRVQNWGGRRYANLVFDPVVNRARRAVGEPARGDTFWGEMLGADAVLGLFSPAFRGPAADDPPALTICGFPWFERHGGYGERAERLDDRLDAFLGAGDPPVIVALGTVLAHTGERLFARAVEACRRVGRRAVLVTGHAHGGRFEGDADVCSVDYAPYGQLFPRGCCTLIHGGIGTTARAMRAGRPAIVLPHAHDQFDNAARLERLGLGQRLDERRASVGRLADAIARRLGDEATARRAAAFGARLDDEDGAEVAAEAIERL
jgi:rhamnosyltransferase subunit B